MGPKADETLSPPDVEAFTPLTEDQQRRRAEDLLQKLLNSFAEELIDETESHAASFRFNGLTPSQCFAVGEASEEMVRQDGQWGYPRDHIDGTGSWLSQLEADRFKRQNEEDARKGTASWFGILLEEVYEAGAEKDPVRIGEELAQVAAVALQWMAAIYRRSL